MSDTYCSAVLKLQQTDVHRQYHDCEYGFPIADDNDLFERLILEINQAGLSWTTILKKKSHFRTAYSNFDVKTVAGYGTEDIARLLGDPGIIRNRLKIAAAIHNAQVILQLQSEFGSYKNWLDLHQQLSKKDWVILFKKQFRFTGGEIVGEFLMSTGYLSGAHEPKCPIYSKVIAKNPVWIHANSTP